jgi:hypothetical protein
MMNYLKKYLEMLSKKNLPDNYQIFIETENQDDIALAYSVKQVREVVKKLDSHDKLVEAIKALSSFEGPSFDELMAARELLKELDQ